MRGTRSTLTRREFLELSGLGILALAATRCSPNPMSSTLQPLPSETVIPPSATATETLIPTDTPTPEPSPTPTETPLPDWDAMDEGTLLNRAPRIEGFTKGSVYGYDQGRYVTYRNDTTGRVEWVFNTENMTFERAGESVWSPEVDGQRVDIKALVVVSKELKDLFGEHFEVPADYDGFLVRQFVTTAAVEYYDLPANGGPHNDLSYHSTRGTYLLSDTEKDEMVRTCVEGGSFQGTGYPSRDFGGGYLRDVVRPGNNVSLRGNSVRPDRLVIKMDYDRNTRPGLNLVPEMDNLIHTRSRNDEMVLKFETSQDLLSPIHYRATRDGVVYEMFTGYWEFGPVVHMMNTLGRYKHLFGRDGPPGFERSVLGAIMRYSYGDRGFVNYIRNARPPDEVPPGVSLPSLVGLPALDGDWLCGRFVRDNP